jgi:phosphate transport system ATP-binding protein
MATGYWRPLDSGRGKVLQSPARVSVQREEVPRGGTHRGGGRRSSWPFKAAGGAGTVSTEVAASAVDDRLDISHDQSGYSLNAELYVHDDRLSYVYPSASHGYTYPSPQYVYPSHEYGTSPNYVYPNSNPDPDDVYGTMPNYPGDMLIDLTERSYVGADWQTSAMPVVAQASQIDARSISAWFGTHKVLDRVSLHMPPGTVTALIGPSGCGKSTFLRILNRMHELIPSASLAGEVLLNGEDIYQADRRVTDTRKRIGMVFQKPNPFPAMTIADNVVAGLKLNGIRADKSEREELIEECLTRGGLWSEVKDRLDRPGGALSGGQQQRLCIARSLAVRPEVLLMDEPCSALDPTSTRRVEETIAALASEVTIVIVTHNMQQAARVSQQCAFFLAEQGTPGFIVESGATEQIFNDPVDPRTSDYVNGRFG